MGFGNGHSDRIQIVGGPAEASFARGSRQMIENVFRQKLGRCVDAFESRQLIEILIVDRLEHGFENVVRAPDIDDDSVFGMSWQRANSNDNRISVHCARIIDRCLDRGEIAVPIGIYNKGG